MFINKFLHNLQGYWPTEVCIYKKMFSYSVGAIQSKFFVGIFLYYFDKPLTFFLVFH